MDQVNDTKLTATRNIIRNKFKQAYTNRVEHEHDVSRVLKPLTTSPLSTMTANLESENKHLSKTTTNDTPQLRLLNRSHSNHLINSNSIKKNKEKYNDPNALCAKLRTLLSSLYVGDMNCTHSINVILDELRDLEIIV